MMVGRDLTSVFPKRAVEKGSVALEVRGLSNHRVGVRDVSLTVRHGEILGIAGLVGSGRTQLAETLFGLTPADAGTIVVDGRPVRISSPRDALRAGIAYVPEDRRRHGVVLEWRSRPIPASRSPSCSRRGLIDRAEERLAARFTGRF